MQFVLAHRISNEKSRAVLIPLTEISSPRTDKRKVSVKLDKGVYRYVFFSHVLPSIPDFYQDVHRPAPEKRLEGAAI